MHWTYIFNTFFQAQLYLVGKSFWTSWLWHNIDLVAINDLSEEKQARFLNLKVGTQHWERLLFKSYIQSWGDHTCWMSARFCENKLNYCGWWLLTMEGLETFKQYCWLKKIFLLFYILHFIPLLKGMKNGIKCNFIAQSANWRHLVHANKSSLAAEP